MVEIVKHCAFGIPPIIIGHHLDEASANGQGKVCNIELRMERRVWQRDWQVPNGQLRKLPGGSIFSCLAYLVQ